MKTAFVLSLILLSAASSPAIAQYTGPSDGKGAVPDTTRSAVANLGLSTVRGLTTAGKDDTHVMVQGRIVRHLGGDRYRFADASGEIDLEIESERWPANTPIDDKAEVRITGEYDKGRIRKPKIEVERIDKVK